MADLNDFFAKKDKKKKGGKKFSKANTDVLAKNLEEKDLKKAEDTTRNYAMPTDANAEGANAADKAANGVALASSAGAGAEDAAVTGPPAARGNDDEWLSYDDEKKDYSGLKIETLKIDDPADEEEEEEHEINEEGEKVKKTKGEGGPWNKAAAQGKDSPDVARREEPVKKAAPEPAPAPPASAAEAAASSGGSSYRPPHLRGGGGPPPSSGPSMGGSMSVNSRMAARRGNRAAPNINSEVNFPSLGGESAERPKGRMDDFEEVRAGGGQQSGGGKSSNGQRLTLGNKFSALRE